MSQLRTSILGNATPAERRTRYQRVSRVNGGHPRGCQCRQCRCRLRPSSNYHDRSPRRSSYEHGSEHHSPGVSPTTVESEVMMKWSSHFEKSVVSILKDMQINKQVGIY